MKIDIPDSLYDERYEKWYKDAIEECGMPRYKKVWYNFISIMFWVIIWIFVWSILRYILSH